MNSSTSSSERAASTPGERRVIARTLLLLAALLGGYSALVAAVPAHTYVPLTSRQENRTRAERLVYGGDTPDVVIVGSSLAGRIPGEALPAGYYNLSLGGSSFLTGLDILERSGRLPRQILIETNVLAREPDRALLEGLFHPILHPIRRAIPAFRQEYQPATYLANLAYGGAQRVRGVDPGRGPRGGARPDSVFFERLVAIAVQEGEQLPDTDSLAERVAHARRLVRNFSARGVDLVFFEMPVDPRIAKTPRLSVERSEMRAIARECGCAWITAAAEYATTDGLHLDADGATRFARFLVHAVESDRLPASTRSRVQPVVPGVIFR